MGFWKKKPLDTRLTDTVNAIKALNMPNAASAIRLIESRTSVGADKLIQLMSLGFRWEISKSADETRRRQYIRAVLLGYGTLGDPDAGSKRLTVAQIEAKKTAVGAMSEVALKALLTRMVQPTVKVVGQRTFVGFDTSMEEQNATWALDKIAEAVTRVQMNLGTVANVPKEQARFREWFGASDPKVIRSNYGKILGGIQGGILLIKDTDPGKNNVFAYVYPDEPNTPPEIYLCEAFWKAGRVEWTNAGGVKARKDNREDADNPLGVILHELSHIFLKTLDHKYGLDECRQLAIDKPGDAAMNADNYEYYAESTMLVA